MISLSTNDTTPIPSRLLTAKEAMAVLHVGRTSFYKLIKLGELPRPIKIGASSRWLESDIANFVRARVSERETLH